MASYESLAICSTISCMKSNKVTVHNGNSLLINFFNWLICHEKEEKTQFDLVSGLLLNKMNL